LSGRIDIIPEIEAVGDWTAASYRGILI